MKKKIVAVMLSLGMVLGIPVVANAESLEERVTALEKRVAELEKMVGIKNEGDESSTDDVEEDELEETSTMTEETDSEPVMMETQKFIDDIAASYNARFAVGGRYTEAELNTMSNDEYIQYLSGVVDAEKDFYEKYKNAVFDDLNIQYLCKTYCDGVKSQMDCCKNYFVDKDYERWINVWEAAYNKRSYVIVELSEYYNAPFGDVSVMKASTEAMDSLNEAETRNAAVDHATVQKTQQLLNDIGFFCGSADGISGKRTVKSIKRFQEMYGYEPIDGMIDDELISQLEDELAKKK